MLEVVYKTKYYVAILDTDDNTVEKISIDDLTKLIKSNKFTIEGVELVKGRLKITPAERSLNENLKIQNGVLLGLCPHRNNLTIRLSDWCSKIGTNSLDLHITNLADGKTFNRITLIFDDNLTLGRGIFKSRGYFNYKPYIFEVFHLFLLSVFFFLKIF